MSIEIPNISVHLGVREDDVLRRNIQQYQELLKGSLGPKARTMFGHLLARARTDLARRECAATSAPICSSQCCDLGEPTRDPLQEHAHDPEFREVEETGQGQQEV